MRASLPCREPGCPSLQPCSRHPIKPWGNRSYKAVGGRGWQQVRARILLRDGGRCAYCGGVAQVVDHVLNRARGGSDDEGNLVACCSACNKKKAHLESMAAGRR